MAHLSGLCPPPLSAPPAEPCLLLLWHQASCQAIPASHQDPGMVSTAACKFWVSNRVSYLGSVGTRQQLLAAAGAPPSWALCSHSHHGDLTLALCHPHRVQQLQPHHGSCMSQLRSQGIWRKRAKWQHFSLLPQDRPLSSLVLGWVRGYPLHWLTTTFQPCRSSSNTELSGPCLHTLSCGGGKRSSWKGQSLQHHRPSAEQKKILVVPNKFCNGVKMCSFIC